MGCFYITQALDTLRNMKSCLLVRIERQILGSGALFLAGFWTLSKLFFVHLARYCDFGC